MGKTSKWFRGLLGLKKPESTGTTPARETTRSLSKPLKKKWSVGKSYGETENQSLKSNGKDPCGIAAAPTQTSDDAYAEDLKKHAIAVAAAAAVVRLTSSGRSAADTSGVLNPAAYVSSGTFGIREEWAAVTIQSHFGAHLESRTSKLNVNRICAAGEWFSDQTMSLLPRVLIVERQELNSAKNEE